jgi:ABC-type Zn2+ transport system substrate-binding protein/surface adhesin
MRLFNDLKFINLGVNIFSGVIEFIIDYYVLISVVLVCLIIIIMLLVIKKGKGKTAESKDSDDSDDSYEEESDDEEHEDSQDQEVKNSKRDYHYTYGPVYHVSKVTKETNKRFNQWKVKKEGATRALKYFLTQKDALDYANKLASKIKGGRVVIHKKHGDFRKKNY